MGVDTEADMDTVTPLLGEVFGSVRDGDGDGADGVRGGGVLIRTTIHTMTHTTIHTIIRNRQPLWSDSLGHIPSQHRRQKMSSTGIFARTPRTIIHM